MYAAIELGPDTVPIWEDKAAPAIDDLEGRRELR